MYGYEGCELVDLTNFLAPLAYTSGFVQVFLGLFLLVLGRKMLNAALIILLFLVTASGGFMVLYNLGAVPGLSEGKTTVMMIVGGVCAVIGGLVTFFFNRMINKSENPVHTRSRLLSSCASAFVSAFLVAAIPMPPIVKLLGILVGGIAGWYLMKPEWSDFITCYGTAFIGSFFFFHGIGSFAGGFPDVAISSISGDNLSLAFIGYAVGIIVFAVGGGIF